MDEVRPKVVFLSRRNLLKVAISNLRAAQLRKKCAGQANIQVGSQCSLGPSHIDVPLLMENLDKTVLLSEMGKAWLRRVKTKLPIMVIYYEDLLENEKSLVEDVLTFLEYEHQPSSSQGDAI